MKIDYELVEGFRALPTKEQKGALADYAQSIFEVKLNKQKSFDNMLADLVAAVPAEKEPELLIDSPDPVIATYTGETVMDEPVINAPNIPEFIEPAGVDKGKLDVEILHGEEVEEELVTALKASVSDSNESKADMAWLDGFSPTIVLMGRSARSNGYYTCPWWIYDWIKKNPDWYKDPDQCPHYSARDTLKSLVYYIKRDGQVTVRETRNSSFDTFKF